MKRTWTVKLPGRAPFQMVVLDAPINYEQALASARVIWPAAEVE